MLAYVFWHTLRGADTDSYESGLAGFHRALAADPPEGFVRSWTLRIDRPAWLPDAPAHYVDWYVVDGFGALGPLNDGAVSGSRRGPHDAVAGLARTGTAGIVGLIAGDGRRAPAADAALQLALVDKPPGEPYDAFRASLVDAAPAATWWMRQMTLGPGAEFIAVAGAGALAALPGPATVLRAIVVGSVLPQAR